MSDVLTRLARLDRARGLDVERLRASAQHWRVATLGPGTLLWKQGRAVDCVGFVLAGELSLLIDGVAVAGAGAGEMIGELVTASPRALQAYTLRADTPVEVALLPALSLVELRARDPDGIEALTRHALRRSAVRTAGLHVETVMFRDEVLPRRRREFEVAPELSVRRSYRPDTPPPVAPWLARLAPLSRAGEEAIAAVAARLSPIRVCPGDLVAIAGEEDGRVLLVVDGAFNVLCARRSGRTAALVAQVGPPTLLGTEALAGMTTRRTSIAAASSGWLFAFDSAAAGELPDRARLAWLEAALAAANDAFRGALRGLSLTLAAFHRAHAGAAPPRLEMCASDSLTAMLRGEC